MKTNYNNKGLYDTPDEYIEITTIEDITEEYKEFTGKWLKNLEFEEVLKLLKGRKVEG